MQSETAVRIFGCLNILASYLETAGVRQCAASFGAQSLRNAVCATHSINVLLHQSSLYNNIKVIFLHLISWRPWKDFVAYHDTQFEKHCHSSL